MEGVEGLDLDWESDNQGDTAWAKEWLDIVAGTSPTAPYFYANLAAILAYDWTAAGVTNYPLWLAWYPYNTPQGWGPLSGLPELRHWSAPAIWQYTSAGTLNGWGGNLDLSIRYQAPSGTITAQSITPAAVQEDDLSQADVDAIYKFTTTLFDQYHTATRAAIIDELKPWIQSSDNSTGDRIINDTRAQIATVPAAVLNQQFKLPDGTVTNLAGILTAINAKPVSAGAAPVTNISADPQAIANAVLAAYKAQINK
jgi:hypothetical protein